jgi:Spy/CpxP family protein refolding chaperone
MVPSKETLTTVKKRTLTAFLLSGFVLASSVFAQSSGTAPTAAQMVAAKVARLTTLLTLTTAQQADATTIFTNEQTALAPLITSMQTARTALQTAVQKNDLTGIDTQATLIGSLTTQEVEVHSKADAAFYAILTPDQVTKYEQIETRSPGGFGRGPGPGVPH